MGMKVVTNINHGLIDFIEGCVHIVDENLIHKRMVLKSATGTWNRPRLGWWASINAAVAQRIRASVYGTEGRGFESLQPHRCDLNPKRRTTLLRAWPGSF